MTDERPAAVLKPARRTSFLWVVPGLVLGLAAWLGYRSWTMHGVEVIVSFEQGFGIEAGADVRYRGISIGEVAAVELADDAAAVNVRVRLRPDAESFARAGARFWIVRPEIGLGGVRGVDTLFGSRYVTALPGAGDEKLRFVGLEEPRVVEDVEDGDLEILIEADRRGGLAAGVFLTYREVQIGTVLGVELADDARTVEARVHVKREYAKLVQPRSRFFRAAGVDAQWGSRFLWMEFGGRIARVLAGGEIAVATPPDGGVPVQSGARFVLHEKAEEEWLEWTPSIPIGDLAAVTSAGLARVPGPSAARLAWKAGIFSRTHERTGWVLPVGDGLLGPIDLLLSPDDAERGSARLEVNGEPVITAAAVLRLGPRLGWRGPAGAQPKRPSGITAPIDAIAALDDARRSLALPAHRMRKDDGGFRLEGIEVPSTWHGAPVVGRATGELLGILVVDGPIARVALLPEAPPIEAKVDAGVSTPP